MKEMFKYGNLCDKYDMSGDIHVGTGIVRVHDIFDAMPAFMLSADIMFCDPPCSRANINSFYMKAEKEERQESYEPFHKRFWQIVDGMLPRVLFVEVFKSNKEGFLAEALARYKNVRVYDSMYYNNPKNKCWIIQASNDDLQVLPIDNVDEEKAIEIICRDVDFECIADPCMGKGLVAFYANKYGKRFVGTELNKYRLAVCLERVTTNSRGKIN